MRSKPTANLPGFSDSAAAADGRPGQRRRDSSPEHGNLGLLEAGLGFLAGYHVCIIG